jgi:hypothetical protein
MKILIAFSLVLVTSIGNITAQRIIAECTINYAVKIKNNNDTALANSLQQTIKTLFVKGNLAKVEIKNPNYYQATIYDKTSGKASIIRELGSNKFLTQLTAEKWVAQNALYNNGVFTTIDSTKKILNYECKLGTISFANAPLIKVYYIPSLVLSTKEVEWQFKDVPGIVLYYEIEEQKTILTYTANSILFSPVPAKIFVVPTKGYRSL